MTPDIIEAAFSGRLGEFMFDAAFTAPARGITGLFGPSGSGKTTLLRCVAGLTRLPGYLKVGGDIWQDDAAGIFRKPHTRALGYVFQDAALFPHLSVGQNLEYAARRARRMGAETRFSLDDVTGFLGLAGLISRMPSALSGGERQRVSIGRALMSQPRLLLLDEPLSALDQQSKDEIIPYLERLRAALAVPCLYVTHDMRELERLADTLILVEGGRVTASGRLSDLQTDPQQALLHAPEASVVLSGEVCETDPEFRLIHLSFEGTILLVPADAASPGDRLKCRIRASDVSFTRRQPVETSILNCIPVRIVSVTQQGDDPAHVTLVAALGAAGQGPQILGRITRKSQHLLGFAVGDNVFAQIKSVSLVRV